MVTSGADYSPAGIGVQWAKMHTFSELDWL